MMGGRGGHTYIFHIRADIKNLAIGLIEDD